MSSENQGREPSTHDVVREQLENGNESIVIKHSGGTVKLTRDQGYAFLAGGELVVDSLTGKAEVRPS